jgi:hypothetical protein
LTQPREAPRKENETLDFRRRKQVAESALSQRSEANGKMIDRLSAAAAILLSLETSASAHRLNEYLQATIICVEKDRAQAFVRLVQGVAVSSIVIPAIDTNGDGIISDTERGG